MIEEFMLLANMTVASKIREDYPSIAFLRHHEPPVYKMLIETQKSLESAGIFIDVASSKGIQSTLWKYCSDDYLGKCFFFLYRNNKKSIVFVSIYVSFYPRSNKNIRSKSFIRKSHEKSELFLCGGQWKWRFLLALCIAHTDLYAFYFSHQKICWYYGS